MSIIRKQMDELGLTDELVEETIYRQLLRMDRADFGHVTAAFLAHTMGPRALAQEISRNEPLLNELVDDALISINLNQST